MTCPFFFKKASARKARRLSDFPVQKMPVKFQNTEAKSEEEQAADGVVFSCELISFSDCLPSSLVLVEMQHICRYFLESNLKFKWSSTQGATRFVCEKRPGH